MSSPSTRVRPLSPHSAVAILTHVGPHLGRPRGILAAFLASFLAPSDAFSIQYVRWAFLSCKSSHATVRRRPPNGFCCTRHKVQSLTVAQPTLPRLALPPSPPTYATVPPFPVLQLHRRPLFDYPKGILSLGSWRLACLLPTVLCSTAFAWLLPSCQGFSDSSVLSSTLVTSLGVQHHVLFSFKHSISSPISSLPFIG